jgi:hypothetical protein
MTMQAIPRIRLGATAMMATLSGCFAVVDVDRFHIAETTGQSPSDAAAMSTDANASPSEAGAAGQDGGALTAPGAYLNLKLTLVGMNPHVAQLFEYRIIDSTNFIQSRGVVNPLGAPDVVINVPQAIPTVNGPFRLDFYADVNSSGGYDGLGSVITNDHAWRIDPLVNYPDGTPSVEGLVQVTFTHNTSFTDINSYPSGTTNPAHDTGLGATIHVINAGAFQGKLIQARVVEQATNRTVGMFRVPQITAAVFDMTIPGVVETLSQYNVLIYVDANGNGIYDNPAAPVEPSAEPDFGWNISGTASTPAGDGGTTGLELTFDPSVALPSNVDVGAP